MKHSTTDQLKQFRINRYLKNGDSYTDQNAPNQKGEPVTKIQKDSCKNMPDFKKFRIKTQGRIVLYPLYPSPYDSSLHSQMFNEKSSVKELVNKPEDSGTEAKTTSSTIHSTTTNQKKNVSKGRNIPSKP